MTSATRSPPALFGTQWLSPCSNARTSASVLWLIWCPIWRSWTEPRKRLAGIISGLDIHYDLGEGHPLLGRRMPDLDLVTADGPSRVFTLLHNAKAVLLNLGEAGSLDITPWSDRVQSIDAEYVGLWELPVLGKVRAPRAVFVRPDGYVAWVGEGSDTGLRDALTTWSGTP